MDFELSCPIPVNEYPVITLAHGSGGTLSHQLVQKMFVPLFDNDILSREHDGAILNLPDNHFAFTTDSFVVQPIFFPGGNIGDLAVNGTVNDLACCGAKPLYLSAGFILEEGFDMEELWEIVVTMKKAADNAGVKVITGDTKVVDRGSGDKIFINTTGIGLVYKGVNIDPANCRAGDMIIITGRIADHGVAVMSARSGLEFETSIKSDTAPLHDLVERIVHTATDIHVFRDPTRGGIASALNEISKAANIGMVLDENAIPVSEEAKAACEILGLDPLYIANEGKLLVILPEEKTGIVLDAIRDHPLGKEAALIGSVTSEHPGVVRMKTTIGSSRVVDMIAGEQLPRIC